MIGKGRETRVSPGAYWKDWSVLSLLCIIAILGYLGQTLPAILNHPIKLDLGLSDSTIGVVTGLGVTLIGALAAFPLAWAADRYGRNLILALSVLIWSAFVAFLAFAEGKSGYAIGLMGFNLGDAAMLPLIYAMVATRFSGSAREWANGILVAVLLLSSSAIYAFGGYLLQYFEAQPLAGLAPWRLVCLAVALVGPVFAFPLLLVRARKEIAVQTQPAVQNEKSLETYVEFLQREGPYLVLLMFAVSIFYTAYMVFGFWLPTVLSRAFDMDPSAANIVLGQTMTAATIVGIVATLISLKAARSRWGHAAPLYLIMIGCLAILLSAFGLFLVTSVRGFLLLLGIMSVGMTIAMMLVPGMLQSCAPDRFRSRTIALFPILSGVMRIALPALVGYFSTRLGEDGEVLLRILGVMLLVCFATSLAVLIVLTPRFASFAERNLADES